MAGDSEIGSCGTNVRDSDGECALF
jgi:hypothetical protein